MWRDDEHGGYGDLAGEYDTLLGPLAEQTWRRGVLAELTRPGVAVGTVVDLGAGTGIGGRLLATTCSARRVGVDQSAAMLQVATGWYEHLVLGELTRLPLRTGSADLVVSGFDTLNYLERSLEPVAARGCWRWPVGFAAFAVGSGSAAVGLRRDTVGCRRPAVACAATCVLGDLPPPDAAWPAVVARLVDEHGYPPVWKRTSYATTASRTIPRRPRAPARKPRRAAAGGGVPRRYCRRGRR